MHDEAFSWLNLDDTRKLELPKKLNQKPLPPKNRPQKHASFCFHTFDSNEV